MKTKNLKYLPVKNIALSLVTDENKSVFDFMLLQSEVLNSNDVVEIISNCDGKYSKLIVKDGKHYSISKDDIPASVILVLKKYGLISSYKEKDSKYEIIHKRK